MSNHEQRLRGFLAGVRRRWLLSEWAAAVGRGALGVALVLGTGLAIGAWLDPEPLGASVIAGVSILVALGVLGRAAWPLLGRLPADSKVARFVEERVPELDDRLASAVEAWQRHEPGPLDGFVLADAASAVTRVDPARLIAPGAVRRRIASAAIALIALAAVVFIGAGPARLAWQSAWLRFFPADVRLVVAPGDAAVVAGEAFAIEARLEGVPAGVAWPRIEVSLRDADGVETSLELAGDASGFAVTVPAVERDVEYRVTAGRLVSPVYRVRALAAPRVQQIDLEYEYPEYSGLEPRREEDGGDVFAPAGTLVRLEIHTDKPIDGAQLALGDEALPLEPLAPDRLLGSFRVSEDTSYRIALRDVDGLSSPGETEYFVRTMDDRPPDVRIERPGGDRTVTPLEEVVIAARADDDFGVDRLELVYSVRGGEEQVIPLHDGRPAATMSGDSVLFLEELDVAPGDFVTYYARARDVGRGKQPTVAQSDIFFLEVRPFGETFVSAQSQAMGAGGGGDLTGLSEAQKEIIVATWKLERRAAAGRSEEDVLAIARAQGGLKDRVARVAGQAGLMAGTGTQGPDPSAPPIAAAVVAMARAETTLDALDASGALPHEMEALNQLLKAEAEVRRRQVSQQAGGGGGGNQSNQDLSALFDRELLRQQQTNYETPASTQQQAEDAKEDPLEAIRELARRQDDLAREQQELARRQQQMDAEELRRRLERLTREQTELRERAEQLVERLASEQSAGARSADNGEPQSGQQEQGQAGSASSGGNAARNAAEAMRGAASDLRREELSAAAEQGERALEHLRSLEAELSHGNPEARRQALNQAQVEASQVAEAQAELAREAEGLGSPQGDGADGLDEEALRGLAERQRALGERARELERVMSELDAAEAPGEEPTSLAEAARAVREEGLGDRMAASADELDRAAGAEEPDAGGELTDVAAEERALAEAAGRVAEHVRAAQGSPGDAESLTEQLADVNDLRERLAELGREMQEASDDSPRSEAGGDPAARGNNPGDPGGSGEQGRLAAEYERTLDETRDLLERLAADPELAARLASPEGQVGSRSAPGTEAFKQDYARWAQLQQDVSLALESIERQLSIEVAEEAARNRLNASGPDTAPDAYRDRISEYYRSLAEKEARRAPAPR